MMHVLDALHIGIALDGDGIEAELGALLGERRL